MMGSYFGTGVSMTNILFKDWNTYNAGDVVLAAAIVFLLTAVFEGLKVLKRYVVLQGSRSPVPQQDEYAPTGIEVTHTSQEQLLSSLQIPASLQLIMRRKIILFVSETLMHTLLFVCGYMLMLTVMTYNVWFLVAVLTGSGLGYFIFNPIGQMLSFKYSNCCTKKQSSRCRDMNQTQEQNVNSRVLAEGGIL